MKKLITALALAALLLAACAPEKADGIPITVYRSPT